MAYTPKQEEVIETIKQTNLDAASNSNIGGIVTKLAELRVQEGAQRVQQVLELFPKLVEVINTSAKEYRDIVVQILSSDDGSIKDIYAIANKEMDYTAEGRKLIIGIAEKMQSDYSKVLDNPNLTAEESLKILDQERSLLNDLRDIDSDFRNHEKDMLQLVDKKDTEKRRFNTELLIGAGTFLAGLATIGFSAFGGRIINTPNNTPKK